MILYKNNLRNINLIKNKLNLLKTNSLVSINNFMNNINFY